MERKHRALQSQGRGDRTSWHSQNTRCPASWGCLQLAAVFTGLWNLVMVSIHQAPLEQLADCLLPTPLPPDRRVPHSFPTSLHWIPCSVGWIQTDLVVFPVWSISWKPSFLSLFFQSLIIHLQVPSRPIRLGFPFPVAPAHQAEPNQECVCTVKSLHAVPETSICSVQVPPPSWADYKPLAVQGAPHLTDWEPATLCWVLLCTASWVHSTHRLQSSWM